MWCNFGNNFGYLKKIRYNVYWQKFSQQQNEKFIHTKFLFDAIDLVGVVNILNNSIIIDRVFLFKNFVSSLKYLLIL